MPIKDIDLMGGWMARERGADWGAGPRAKDPQRVDWREIKSAIIYRLEQRVENARPGCFTGIRRETQRKPGWSTW